MSAVPGARRREFVYEDEERVPLYRVVRLDLPDGTKQVWQERSTGNGNWTTGLENVRRVLYHLPDLAGAEVVHVAEGEGCADDLRVLGLNATTAAMGTAAKWTAEYTHQIKGTGARLVVVWPDCDEAGRAHARDVAEKLTAAELEVRREYGDSIPS